MADIIPRRRVTAGGRRGPMGKSVHFAAVPFLYLKLHEPGGRRVRLHGKRIRVGRSERCGLTIRGTAVSRQHARLSLQNGCWVVEDLGSANGTLLNGKLIERAELVVGDRIMFGKDGVVAEVRGLDVSPRRKKSEPEVLPVADATILDGPTREAPVEDVHPQRGSFPWLVLAGMVFGSLTGLAIWGDRFPYREVAATGLWAVRGLQHVAPEWVAPRLGWVVIAALALHGAVVGHLLRHPLRRWFWIAGFAGAQVICVYKLDAL